MITQHSHHPYRLQYRLHCRLLLSRIMLLLALSTLTPAFLMAATQPAELRFAYQNRIGSVLPIIAVQQGLFAAQGLQVHTQVFSSGPACAEAIFSGAADIATMGDTTAVIALSRARSLRLLTSHANGEHRHRVMVMNPQLHSVTDLRGKRIGIKKGTSTFGGLLALLEHHGLTVQDVTLVNLSPAIMIEALQAGSIDALVASEPTPSLAEIKGAHQLTTLGDLGNNYPVLLLATQNICQQQPQQLKAFLRALDQAKQFLEHHREEAEQIIATTLSLPLDITRRAMQLHEYPLLLDDSTVRSLNKTADFLCQQNIIPATDRAIFARELERKH